MRYGVYGELLAVCAAYSSCDMTISFGSSFSVLCGPVLFWPLLCLLVLNYALVLGHGPTLEGFIWSRDANVLQAMQEVQEALNSLSPRALLMRNQGRNFPQVFQSRTALLLLKNWFDFLLLSLWIWLWIMHWSLGVIFETFHSLLLCNTMWPVFLLCLITPWVDYFPFEMTPSTSHFILLIETFL